MSVFDLQKRQQTVAFVLEKRNLTTAPSLRVGAALDTSGSTNNMYRSGVMQQVVDRLVPIAMRFDDNGELDMWVFDTDNTKCPPVTKQDYEDYVDKAIIKRGLLKGNGTKYGPTFEDISQFYFPSAGNATPAAAAAGFFGGLFGKKAAAAPAPATSASDDKPAMVLFITDGATYDEAYSEKILRAAKDKPVYWQLVGVGNPSEFDFLEKMGDALPNVGFVHLADLNLTDEKLYDALLTQELCDWMKRWK
ncbi:VWA domain-containing protein [Nostoc sp. CHAB 5834]|nr:VWA domain-containing protein [Nostoc sp. CHAB 5834]